MLSTTSKTSQAFLKNNQAIKDLKNSQENSEITYDQREPNFYNQKYPKYQKQGKLQSQNQNHYRNHLIQDNIDLCLKFENKNHEKLQQNLQYSPANESNINLQNQNRIQPAEQLILEDYRQKLLDLSKQYIQRQEIFQKIETFRVGTFKYTANPNYQPDPTQAYQEARKSYQQMSQNYNPLTHAGFNFNQSQDQKIKEIIQKRKPEIKFFKTFQNMYPYMYLNIDKGSELGREKKLQLNGKQIYEPLRNQMDSTTQNTNPQLIHNKIQFKFSIRQDALLQYEENRSLELESQILMKNDILNKNKDFFVDYLLNIEFANIKKLWFQQNESNYTTLLIELKKPCQSIKMLNDQHQRSSTPEQRASGPLLGNKLKTRDRTPDRVSTAKMSKKILRQVRSPFNMLTTLENEMKFDDLDQMQAFEQVWQGKDGISRKRAEIGTLLNYWNNQQVFLFQGQVNQDNFVLFLDSLQRLNSNCSIMRIEQDHKLLDLKIHNEKSNMANVLQLREHSQYFANELNKMMPCIRFAVLALLSSKKVNIFNIGLIEFMRYINDQNWSLDQVKADFCSYILDQINLNEDLDFREDNGDKLKTLFIKYKNDPQTLEEFAKIDSSDDHILQRRCLVTPTMIHFTVSRDEESNKVLRQYKKEASRFIRVSFVNENLDKGFYFSKFCHGLLGYIHAFLQNGFFVGNSCKLVFLNYSNSQLKNHTCWFLSLQPPSLFPQTKVLTVDDIIISMGEFQQEKNILKKYARRGQCFSTTKNIDNLKSEDIYFNYPDIDRNGHCFSDGCGWIHPEVAQLVAEKFQVQNISAFQIRLGGAKGVVAVNKNLEIFKKPNSDGYYKILLRKSQIKFPSNNLSLDVVRCATFSQGYLNRQIILLLHSLGVPTEFFIRKQNQAKQLILLNHNLQKINDNVQKIRQKFDYDQNLICEQKKNEVQQKNRLIQELEKLMKLIIEPCKSFKNQFFKAFLKGFDLLQEPAFCQILHCMQLNQILSLKKKSRIILPNSCVLIGIVDPTGLLEENQVFFQIRKDNLINSKFDLDKNQSEKNQNIDQILNGNQNFTIIQGSVLVTRNPCNHPGDIRLLEAIDCPELQYLYNVIVFSSKGDRPQFSKMSGGDLDGDTYFATWDKELISYIEPHNLYPPADYSKTDLIKEKPESDDLADYFVFYLQRDVLGIVSNLWLQLADMEGQDGPKKSECLALAQMCSVAVDFAKHGECVSPENFDHLQQIVTAYNPDFMERPDQFGVNTINSNGVLGRLYRDSSSSEVLLAFLKADYNYSILRNFKLDQNILRMAYASIELQGLNEPEDNQNPKIQELLQKRNRMHSYLPIIYEKIVFPMSQGLKRIMLNFQLASESELFACDLKFRLFQNQNFSGNTAFDDKQIYLGDPGTNNEDALKNLNRSRRDLIAKYYEIFQQLCKEAQKDDEQAQLNLAVALYLGTYFDCNQSGMQYYQMMKNDENFDKFVTLNCQNQNIIEDNQIQQQLKESFQFFQVYSADSESGDLRKLRQLLNCKKLFGIPWLIAGEVLMNHYPDHYQKQNQSTEICLNKEISSKDFQKQILSRNREKALQEFTIKSQNLNNQQLGQMSEEYKLNKIFKIEEENEVDGKENQRKYFNEELSNYSSKKKPFQPNRLYNSFQV